MVKYDKNRKLDRNRRLIECHRIHPELSLEEVGRRFGRITKQAVLDILQRNATPTKEQITNWIAPNIGKWHGKYWRLLESGKVIEDKDDIYIEVNDAKPNTAKA